jgi:Cu(I)/Ag(I) efflux system membrane fusion protein
LESLQAFLTAADTTSSALASDDHAAFARSLTNLSTTLQTTLPSLPPDHPWHTPLAGLVPILPSPDSPDLTAARHSFMPFSTELVRFARDARRQNPALASLQLYVCPMAHKPGVWLQLQPPLRNPYYGSEMLECGTELKPGTPL